MRIHWVSLSCAVAILACAAAPARQPLILKTGKQPFASGLLDRATGEYEDPSLGVKFVFPMNWQVSTLPTGDLQALFPAWGKNPQLREGVGLSCSPSKPGHTLDQWFSDNKENLAKSMASLSYKKIEESSVNLAGRNAKRIVYSFQPGDPPQWTVKSAQTFVLTAKVGCMVSYIADLEDFDSFLPIVSKAAGTLSIHP